MFSQLQNTITLPTHYLISDMTGAEGTDGSVTSFNSNGFSLGTNITINENSGLLSSWTFRKQPKFFDIVTYTGNGANRTISHNLGSTPGCIIIKKTFNNIHN